MAFFSTRYQAPDGIERYYQLPRTTIQRTVPYNGFRIFKPDKSLS
jgi:hypothetical protein